MILRRAIAEAEVLFDVEMAVVAVVSDTDPPREEIMPTKIKEVLKEWGCTWMWKSLLLVGSDE